jgi:hypothetical protein
MCNVINNTTDLGYRHNNPVEFNRAESRLIVYKAIKVDTPASGDSCSTAGIARETVGPAFVTSQRVTFSSTGMDHARVDWYASELRGGLLLSALSNW